MPAALARLNPFQTPEARRLGVLFGVVYFAQGMWYLPNQPITVFLKDRGLSAGEKRMLAKARQILVSELALAEGTDEERAEVLLDEVLATATA